MWQDYFRLLLSQKYKKAKSQNKSYSMRAFGEKLGLASGDISELLAGKRIISKTRALKISQKLDLTAVEESCLTELINNKERLPRKTLLSAQEFILESQTYIPILCALELDDPLQNTKSIAKQLGLSVEVTSKALKRLEAADLIRKEKDGRYRMKSLSLQTTEDIPKEIHQQALIRNLQLTQRAITELDVSLRECSSITFAGSSKMFQEMVSELRRLRDRMTLVASKEHKDEIYQLNLSLIPLTQKKVKI